MPKGGPSGGDGGTGGSVFLVVDVSLNTLQRFKQKTVFKADDGGDGGTKNMHGGDGGDIEVLVPPGTEVFELVEDSVETKLGELTEHGQKMKVAAGGRGGWGNARFTSSINQAPLLAEAGDKGERRKLRLSLKLLADVGLVGMPNAGKSSILAAISSARPKIADYPFTTLEPVLGVVYRGHEQFIAVDIPGLIEGAHRGVGLGVEFLKHVERTRVLVHVTDGAAEAPAVNVELVNRELQEFGHGLTSKPQVIAINKLDLPGVRERRSVISGAIRRGVGHGVKVMFVSAATHEGLDALIEEVWRMLQAERAAQAAAPSDTDPQVLRPEPVNEKTNAVVEAPGVFRIVHPWAVRLARGSNLNDHAVRVQYHARLGHMKVLQDLRRLGVKPGDRVLVAEREFVWE